MSSGYEDICGPSIVGGVVRRTSASALTTADPNSYGGCPRRYHLSYVLNIKEPQTAAMTRGTKMLHEPIENYYKTGADTFTPLALQVRRYLYPREWFLDGRLLVENEIGRLPGTPGKTIDLSLAPVRAGGVPLVGKADQLQDSGFYLDDEGAYIPDGATVEIGDLKSTKSAEFAKSPDELRKTVQMLSYAKFAIAWRPSAQWFRLSHIYALTTGANPDGFKRTVLIDRDEVEQRWQGVDSIGRSLIDIAKETDFRKVPTNTKSCTAYRGCPHRRSRGGVCDASEFNSLADRLGSSTAGGLIDLLTEDTYMGILGKSGITLPPSTTNAPAPTPAPATTSSLADLLDAETVAQAPAPAAAQPAHSPLDPRVIAAFDVLEASGLGCPVLSGPAADARAAYTLAKTGKVLAYTPGAPLTGSGKLAGLTALDTVDGVIALGEQLAAHAAKRAATPTLIPESNAPAVGILAPDAPASSPALASKAPEGIAPPIAPPIAPIAPIAPVQATAPAAPASVIANGAVQDSGSSVQGEIVAPRRSPGRPPGSKTKAADEPFELYIGAVPSQRFEMLDAYVAKWHGALLETFRAKGVPFVVDHIGTGPKDVKAIGYGEWRYTAEALGNEMAREGGLPRGRYVSLAKDDLTAAIVNGIVSSGALDNVVRGGGSM